MYTQNVSGRVYDFSHAVGRGSEEGRGFGMPISLAFGEGDTVYVLSRGFEAVSSVPWNFTSIGARVGKYTIGSVPGDEAFVTEFGGSGDAESQFIWPVEVAVDSVEDVYVTDEWLHRVSIFDKNGNFLRQWGSVGGGDGEINRPSGIGVDRKDNVYVVDSMNHRVQKFTKDGTYLAKWGRQGTGEGEFDTPWGLTLDDEGYVYVADHRNNRIQKFTPEGEFVAKFGSYGTGRGQLCRPAGVAVDPDGDVYACDWGNDRVQAFGPDGKFITSFIGDAQELSAWQQMVVDGNVDIQKARRRAYTTEPEWRFALPTGIAFDADKGRFLVTDPQRLRLQIYNKLKGYLEPQFNL